MASDKISFLDKWYIQRVQDSLGFIIQQVNYGLVCKGGVSCSNDPFDYSNVPIWDLYTKAPRRLGNGCNRLHDSEAFNSALNAAIRSKYARAPLSVYEIPARALMLKCVVLRRGETPPSRQVAKAIRESGDIASWGLPGFTLIKTIMNAIAYQVDVFTRLELLSALYEAPIPLYWFDTITSGIKRADELLPQSDLDQKQRQAMFNKLREVEGRIQQLQAEKAMAEVQLSALMPGQEVAVGSSVFVNDPSVGLTAKPPGGQKTSWTPYIVLGAVLATGAGLVTVAAVQRRRRSLLAPAA